MKLKTMVKIKFRFSLEIKINPENNKLVTSVYRKLTFSGVFTNFESFISKSYKCNLIVT